MIHAICLLAAFAIGCQDTPQDARQQLEAMQYPYDRPAFFRALENGDAAAVALFLQAGMSPDTHDDAGTPILLWAARHNTAILKLLIEAQADPHAVDRQGHTALMLAARSGPLGGARLLLEAGARANERTAAGETALMYAAERGDTTLVGLLLGAGADIHATDPNGVNALVAAAVRGRAGAVKQLIEAGAAPNYRFPSGTTVLMTAVAERQPTVVEALLAAGADPRAVAGDSTTAATVARRLDDLPMRQRILAALGEKALEPRSP